MTTKPRETLHLPATLRPGDFPLGSMESRAAARMLSKRRQDEDVIITRIINDAGEVLEEHVTPAEAGTGTFVIITNVRMPPR